MMPRSVLGYALLLPMLLGCSSSPTTTPTGGERTVSIPSGRPSDHELTLSPRTQPGQEKPRQPTTAAPMNPAVTRTKEAGIIRGRVLARGKKGAADAAVWVATPELKSPEPTDSVALVQSQDRYSPRVHFARVGQRLQLRTSDARADFHASGAATFSDSLTKGQVRSHRLTTPGAIEVRSQLRPDLAPAWIYVVPHDWYAVSDTDGTFRLAPLPAGEYSVVLTALGGESPTGRPVTQRVSVKLEKGEGAAIEWTLPEK